MINIPKLDFLPPMPKFRQREALTDKSGEILSLRENGALFIKRYQKKKYVPGKEEINWIFRDTFISTPKVSAVDYIEKRTTLLEKQYPYEVTRWFHNFYSVWRYLRLTCHIQLPNTEAQLFYSLARPFPPKFSPPETEQDISYSSVLEYLYRQYIKDLKVRAIQEILENTDLTNKVVQGELVPYRFLEILPVRTMFEKVTNELIKYPELQEKLSEDSKSILKSLRGFTDIKPRRKMEPRGPSTFSKEDKKKTTEIARLIREKGLTIDEALTEMEKGVQ